MHLAALLVCAQEVLAHRALAASAFFLMPPQAPADSTPSTLREAKCQVQDAVGEQLQIHDPQQMLRAGDFQDVLDECVDKVLKVMAEDQRSALDDEDKGFIERRVRQRVYECFEQYRAEQSTPRRYKRTERVVCLTGGNHRWASGSVVAVNEVNPEDGYSILPYVVKLDGPQRRLISVPKVLSRPASIQRRPCALFALPPYALAHPQASRRFGSLLHRTTTTFAARRCALASERAPYGSRCSACRSTPSKQPLSASVWGSASRAP